MDFFIARHLHTPGRFPYESSATPRPVCEEKMREEYEYFTRSAVSSCPDGHPPGYNVGVYFLYFHLGGGLPLCLCFSYGHADVLSNLRGSLGGGSKLQRRRFPGSHPRCLRKKRDLARRNFRCSNFVRPMVYIVARGIFWPP